MSTPERTEITVRFPLGVYHAQSTARFDEPEWPPHPVRMIAALVAAAASLEATEHEAGRRVIAQLSAVPEPPVIVAPRAGDGAHADGRDVVAALRGAAQWAPRNHELSELGGGIHPRELGRGRAEVFKGGVAIGEQPIVFSWPITLDDDEHAALSRVADEVTVLGTSRSPVLVSVTRTMTPIPAEAWTPRHGEASDDDVEVRVPSVDLLAVLDEWHERRRADVSKRGKPVRVGLVPPASLGRTCSYVHGASPRKPSRLDPQWWGDVLIVAVHPSSSVKPKIVSTYGFARALRAALLAQYAAAGADGEAPAVLRGRGNTPHAAIVPLPFVGHERATGGILGSAVILPHRRRLPDALLQRRAVEAGMRALVAGANRPTVGTPGVGDVTLGVVAARLRANSTLDPARWRRASATWSTVTPVVHSRYRRNRRPEGLLEQIAADCRDVGIPAPRAVEIRRTSRFAGAAPGIARTHLPDGWRELLRGPVDHLDLEFDQPVVGPLLLGRARHFGLGLCLPHSLRDPT